MPFCTTSWAVETALATLGLASNVCGSVLGLLSIAVTRTYLPPICPITFAYSFSAPTATTWSPEPVAADVDEQAVASTPAVTASAATAIPRRERMIKPPPVQVYCTTMPRPHRLNTNENDNQYEYRGQAVRPPRPAGGRPAAQPRSTGYSLRRRYRMAQDADRLE